MEFRLRLSDADRERLDVPEVIVADLGRLGQLDAEYLDDLRAERPGKDYPDPDTLVSWLRGPAVLGADGSPVLRADGKPETRPPVRGLRLLVWLALRQLGRDVEFDSFDFERHEVTFPERPKDPATSPSSESPSEA